MTLDNPTDHEHSDYSAAIGLLNVLLIAITALSVLWPLVLVRDQADRINDLKRRQDALECRVAPDEVRCLRELVED